MEGAFICTFCENGVCKEEWKNDFENDGTPDNSYWTSIQTDGLPGTSPSPNVYESAASQETISQSSIDEMYQNPAHEGQDSEYESEDNDYCTGCQYDTKHKQRMCYNGSHRVPDY